MKTKTVYLWCDLYPGWQDSKDPYVSVNQTPNEYKPDSFKRVRITVELPCFGGSADVDVETTANAQVTEERIKTP